MPLNPASLIFALQEWVEKKILGHLQPLRVDYDDSFLKIELLPWAHMTAILAGFLVLMVVVSLASGSWTGLIVALFFGALPALLLTLASQNPDNHRRQQITAIDPRYQARRLW